MYKEKLKSTGIGKKNWYTEVVHQHDAITFKLLIFIGVIAWLEFPCVSARTPQQSAFRRFCFFGVATLSTANSFACKTR
jgi:hypothetical protein